MLVNTIYLLFSYLLGMVYKHIVPTGLKRVYMTIFYKHIVPTKSTPNARLAFVGTEELIEIC